jgi:hypothetical protein
VTPYPPGFPILVPGQVVTNGIIEFLLATDVKEIHGFHPDLGLRVFTEKALEALAPKLPVAGDGQKAIHPRPVARTKGKPSHKTRARMTL